MKTLCRHIILLAVSVLTAWPVMAVDFVPIVTYHPPTAYGAALQNWAVAQGDNGEIYVGNNSCVLSYDGYTWQRWPLPGNATARALLYDRKRLYVGSLEQFGYMVRDSKGSMVYHSLWDSLHHFTPHNDEIWKIIRRPNGHIIFQSFSSWFEYDGHTVIPHYDAERLPLYFFGIGNSIYAQLINAPFCLLDGTSYRPIILRAQIGDDDVVAAMAWSKGHIMLCSEFHGLFLYDGTQVRPFTTTADTALKRAQINRAILSNDGHRLIIGTIRDGIFGFDRQGRLLWHYNTQHMLGNNTVLNLFCDRDDNLWAALDIGVALIQTGAPYALLTNSATPLGMVYDIAIRPDAMYLATNQSTYRYSRGLFQTVEGTEGQNWHVSALGSQLIVGNNHGTKLIDGLVARRITGGSKSGGTAIRRYALSGRTDHDVLIESSYAELRAYRQEDNRWVFSHIISGFMAPIRQFEIDGRGVIWAVNINRGYYRIELTPDLGKVARQQYFPSLDGSATGLPIHITKFNGTIIFTDGQHVYRLDNNRRPVPYPELETLTRGDITAVTPVDQSTSWIASSHGYSLLEHINDSLRLLLYVPATYFNSECSDNFNNIYVSDGMAYLCLNDGVGRIDMTKTLARKPLPTDLHLLRASYTTSRNTICLIPVDTSVPSVQGNLTLTLSYPNYNNAPLQFEYTLQRGGTITRTVSHLPCITYNTLSYGSYIFIATVHDANGHELGTTLYRFNYPRPLYLTWYAFLLYLLIIALLLHRYIKWTANRLMRKRHRLMEQEQMKQNLLFLEQQLQSKGKEIASLAMNSLRRQQQVNEIRHELSASAGSMLSADNIRRMLKHITDNIDNDTYWDIYRENFDLIHKNFFRNLRKCHPELTATDMKFCALLRLNLSTKEIAQFTGLTTRGVEGARYRLRKKLGLPKDQSFTQYLIDIS